MAIAEAVSTRSTCPRARVGAVVVVDNRVIATGYNGAAPGEEHCTDVGCLVEDGHCQRALHAEVNAIAQCARMGVSCKNASLYIYFEGSDVSHYDAPCRECMKVIKSAGIDYWRIAVA